MIITRKFTSPVQWLLVAHCTIFVLGTFDDGTLTFSGCLPELITFKRTLTTKEIACLQTPRVEFSAGSRNNNA